MTTFVKLSSTNFPLFNYLNTKNKSSVKDSEIQNRLLISDSGKIHFLIDSFKKALLDGSPPLLERSRVSSF